MTIHTSQQAMISFFNTLMKPEQFCIIETNINVKNKQQPTINSKNAFQLLSKPNAGGSSIYSEALSIEILSRLLGVDLYKTETELKYSFIEKDNNGGSGPIMDYACHYCCPSDDRILTLGVSVTRAMTWNSKSLKQVDTYRLLNKKLRGLYQSSEGILNAKFDRHILHIWTESGKNASLVRRVTKKLYLENKYKNTIVLISIVNNDLVFFNNNHYLSLIK